MPRREDSVPSRVTTYLALCVHQKKLEHRVQNALKTLHMRFGKWTDDNQRNENILHHYDMHFHKTRTEKIVLLSWSSYFSSIK